MFFWGFWIASNTIGLNRIDLLRWRTSFTYTQPNR